LNRRMDRRQNDPAYIHMNLLEELKTCQEIAHARLLALKSDVLHGVALEPKKAVELAAVAVCVVVECRSCLELHVARAVQCGAAFEEVLEAVEAGIQITRGRTGLSTRSAITVINEAFASRQANGPGPGVDSASSFKAPTDGRRDLLKKPRLAPGEKVIDEPKRISRKLRRRSVLLRGRGETNCAARS